MMYEMSPSKDSERPGKTARPRQNGRDGKSEGVLSQLPRTRPQRSSPRRVAARRASAADQDAVATPARANGRAPSSPGSAAKADSNGRAPSQSRTGAKAAKTAKVVPTRAVKRPTNGTVKPLLVAEPAPLQGFECEGERTGGSVHPPGGAELVASAAEIVGELAKAGFSTGERLLKDVLSRLPLS
jgi:hypothetical protein